MPIGTSDGQYHETEYDYAVSTLPVADLPTHNQRFNSSESEMAEHAREMAARRLARPYRGFSVQEQDQLLYDYEQSPMQPIVRQDMTPAGRTSEEAMAYGDNVIYGADVDYLKKQEKMMEEQMRVPKEEFLRPKPQSISETPITQTSESAGEPSLRITITPELLNKPMDEPFKNEEERRGVFNALTGADGKDRYQTWPEKAVRTVLDAFALPGDVAQGKEAPDSPKTIGRAFELAGALIFGPAPIANKIVDGTLGSIAGVSAKGADMHALQNAKAWERMGYPAEQIYEHSGWFRGFDKQWKHELPSENALLIPQPKRIQEGIKTSGSASTTLGDVLDFPDLYKAYPELKKLDVTWDKSLDARGQYDPHLNLMVLNPFQHKTVDDILETTLHEIQHWIQKKEGFDFGTNPESAAKTLINALHEKLTYAKSPEDIARITKLIRENEKASAKLGDEIYTGNPGEREARMVEISRTLDPEFKKQVSPVRRQKAIDEANPTEYEVRMPWEKPPITLD